jgi:tetratricopeptide (TPR) repeat protein
LKVASLALALGLFSIWQVAQASPTILIYQSRVPIKDKDDPNIDISKPIWQEYDQNGRLTPIVYSPSDPTLKSAVASGKLADPPIAPSDKQLFAVARKLGVDYVLVVQSQRVGKIVDASLKLFKDQRQIWTDEDNLAVTLQDIIDPQSTALSIAHTFVLRMNATPLKGFADHPKAQNPQLQPGQTPVVAPISAKPIQKTNNEELKVEVDSLIKANHSSEAILKLRDAVDQAPLDLERRLLLINELQVDQPLAAASEARRAAIVMPEKVELRVLAARAWIRAGKPNEAQEDLNEAVARDPNGASTRLLLAELSLGHLEPSKALGHLDEAIKQQDTSQARFLRAICRSMLGGIDGMNIDLKQVDKLEPTRTPDVVGSRYAQATDILDHAFTQDVNDLRSLIPKIVVKPKDSGLRDQLEQMLRLLQSRTTFLTLIEIPSNLKLPHDQRILAHKLLAQSIIGVQSYSNNSDEDTLAEARINLGEALKQLKIAQTPASK